jgi:hypothetical protein
VSRLRFQDLSGERLLRKGMEEVLAGLPAHSPMAGRKGIMYGQCFVGVRPQHLTHRVRNRENRIKPHGMCQMLRPDT